MKNIYPNIYKNSPKNLNKAKNFLKRNGIIAVPTETVYGLAGNAYSYQAIKKIYVLKKRPKKNPLIIHYDNIKKLKKDAFINPGFLKLYKKFCPGPLTFILKKRKDSKICSLANANLNTLAVRFPGHSTTKKILKKLNFPLAMPSANKSSALSPISALDVIDEFGKSINFIIDGGKSKIGLESTVINLVKNIKITRPGAISKKELSKVLGKKISTVKKINKIYSPGMLKKHYSPGIPVTLNCKTASNKDAFIVFGKKYKKGKNIFNLSYKGDLKQAAKNLYKTMRKIKNLNFKKIKVVKIPNRNIGIAINDRLTKASNK